MTKYAALLLLAQTLNPTVEVLQRPTAAVPANCEDGLVPAPAPRIVVSEIPEVAPVRAEAPPSARLRSQLRAVHEAAKGGDREAFRAALADVKATIAEHPAGRERDEAVQAVRIYDDIDRLWNWQSTSPTGAFFEEADEGLLSSLRKYPEYERSVADATIVSGGRRIYPSGESREFLVSEARRRVGGASTGAPAPPRVVTRTVAPSRRSSGATTASVVGRRRSGGAPAPDPAPDRSPEPAPPAGEAPAAPPSTPVATTTTMAEEAPVAAPPVTTTTATTSTPTTTQPEPAKPAEQRRNIILPVLVVAAAIGFLIFLFRASR